MFGGIASAIGSVAGGLLGNMAASDANATNAALTREQIAYQKELHQNQLQWRVEDAKKAGLHPLAGLGVSSYSFSPVSFSQSPLDYSWLGEAGQNINSAVQRGKDARERKQAEALAADTAQVQMEAALLQNDALRFQIEGQMLDNDVRRMEIASRLSRSTDRTQIGPPAPSVKGVPGGIVDGQEQSGYPMIPEYAWTTDERGLPVELSPSQEQAEMWESFPVAGAFPILAIAKLKSLYGKIFGSEVEGKYWDSKKGAFVSRKPVKKTREADKWLSRPRGYYGGIY